MECIKPAVVFAARRAANEEEKGREGKTTDFSSRAPETVLFFIIISFLSSLYKIYTLGAKSPSRSLPSTRFFFLLMCTVEL